jgi:hypothetical protein
MDPCAQDNNSNNNEVEKFFLALSEEDQQEFIDLLRFLSLTEE